MNLKNCPKCKKLFSPLNGQLICSECEKKEVLEFNLVRDFLRENRGADINIVSEETGVSVKKILNYLKQGKLEVTEGMGEFLKCEKCGIPIKTGQFCRSCTEKIGQGFQNLCKTNNLENNQNYSGKMHIRRQ